MSTTFAAVADQIGKVAIFFLHHSTGSTSLLVSAAHARYACKQSIKFHFGTRREWVKMPLLSASTLIAQIFGGKNSRQLLKTCKLFFMFVESCLLK